MTNVTEKNNIVVSAFRCSEKGLSEAYVGYQWANQIIRKNNVYLLAPNYIGALAQVNVRQPNLNVNTKIFNKLSKSLNSAVKFDYFYFDFVAFLKCRKEIKQADLFHHVTPIAPRYHSLAGLSSKKMIIGPVGGGLEIPAKFESLSAKEPIYNKLRKLDKFRLNFDPLLRMTYNKAEKILIVGKYMYKLLPEKIHHKCELMLETGINIEDYPQIERTGNNKYYNSPLRLLYVGRVVPYKGLSLLIKAISILEPSIRKKISLEIVGSRSGTYGNYCTKLARSLGVGRQCKFVGSVQKERVYEYYKNSDVFCFPSLAETSGNVILEAMAMSLPIIGINRGGPAEIVNKNCGFLIDAQSPEYVSQQLALMITTFFNNRELIINMGRAARKRVRDHFTWEKKGEKLFEIYRSVLNE